MNPAPRVVVLDGHALNPGDLAWTELERLGDSTIHACTAATEVVACSRGATILLTNKTPLGADIFAQLPDLHVRAFLAGRPENVVN